MYVRTNRLTIHDTEAEGLFFKEGVGYCTSLGLVMIPQADIIKQGDTLDKVCDGFWIEKGDYDPIHLANVLLVLDRIHEYKESDRILNTNELSNLKVYGSCYVKGHGWQHIAELDLAEEKLTHTWKNKVVLY